MKRNRPAIITLVSIWLAVAAVAMASAAQPAAQKPAAPALTKTERDILAVMELQKAAWNKGDIEGYMASYWKSDALTFQSGGRRSYGWEKVLADYKKGYGPGKMGTLDFTDLEFHVLAKDAAYVLGRFKLEFEDGRKSEGVFTVILRKTAEGWRIIHDHSSS